MRRPLPLAVTLGLALGLAACGQQEQAPVDPAAPAPSGASPEQTQPPASAVAAMDPARLANPCLLDAGVVGAALGFTVEKTEPEMMGTMSGCTYHGKDVSLRLNFIVHDPVYFAQATEMTRKTRPGDKRDLAGDPDKAWVQQDGGGTPILHYYRQNVEVELAPLVVGGGDAKAIEAALLKLPRVP